MPFTVTLQPSGHSFPASANEPILQAALDAGYNLPYGCRNGACGACKGKVVSGTVDFGEAEAHVLTADDRAAGMALFCCATARSDLVLEVKEVGLVKDIPVKIMPCRVQHMERLADDVMLMTLKLPTNERLQFLAGQYIEFLLKDGKRRAFSLANAPHDDEFLQLHVRLIPGGSFTDYVFHAMKEKEILRFEGPHGSFFLREDSTKPIIFLAGGTGFAPIKGIVEHTLHNHVERPMTLYWGARNYTGLYMPDQPLQWAATHGHIKYVPVLSDPDVADAWTGRTGLVHEAVLADLDKTGSDLSGHQVYACGAPAMIEAAKRDFVTRGLPEDEFFADVFSFAARTQQGTQ
jgi:CDP-4-dehydro-6-deoxyglucose reductase